MADCDETIRLLYHYLDQVIDTQNRVEIDEHLLICTDCQGRLEFEHSLKIALRERNREEEIPPELKQRLLDCFKIDVDHE